MAQRVQQLETEASALKERNKRVEGDKAWEISYFRSCSLAAATYVVSAVVLKMIDRENFFVEALVPALGYLLSTLSLPAVKRWWVRKFDSRV